MVSPSPKTKKPNKVNSSGTFARKKIKIFLQSIKCPQSSAMPLKP